MKGADPRQRLAGTDRSASAIRERESVRAVGEVASGPRRVIGHPLPAGQMSGGQQGAVPASFSNWLYPCESLAALALKNPTFPHGSG